MISSGSSSSSKQKAPSPVKDSREGPSGVQPEERGLRDGFPSSLSFSHDKDVPIFEDPESLALVWQKIRAKDCALPDLDRMSGREAYTGWRLLMQG